MTGLSSALFRTAAEFKAARKEMRSSAIAMNDARRAHTHGELTAAQLEAAVRRHHAALARASDLAVIALNLREALKRGAKST